MPIEKKKKKKLKTKQTERNFAVKIKKYIILHHISIGYSMFQ